MQDLRARLADKGFTDVSFRIINVKASINDIDENEGVEILKKFAGDIPVIQEPEFINPPWQTILDGGTDHILVLDRCGRLAYQVISPWSLLGFPYVKAAILSTINDDPCGVCNTTELEAQSGDTSFTDEGNTTFALTPISSEIQTTPKPLQISENIVSESTYPSFTAKSMVTPSISIDVKNEADFNSEVSYEEITDIPTQYIQDLNEPLQIISNDTIVDPSHSQNETVNPRASNSSEIDLTTDSDILEGESIYTENELDATLSPLAERKDGNVPVRVIMRFPHKHRLKNGTIVSHEYLVLQTGNPDYHGHLESEENQNLLLSSEDEHQTHKRGDDVDENLKSKEKIRHKAKKYRKKFKPHKSDESIDSHESNEEPRKEPKKHKGKKKNKEKPLKSLENTDSDRSQEEKSIEIGKTNQERIEESEESKETEETTQEKSVEKIKNKDSHESRDHGSTEEKIKHKGRKKYQSKENENSKEDDNSDSSSEVSQDIRKHGKHHSQSTDNNTLHFNMIKQVLQKPGRNHIHKIVQVSVGGNNDNNTRDHIKKIKVNKIVVGSNDNDTDPNVITTQNGEENGSNQFIKKVEVHKKKYYHKKTRISFSENFGTTTTEAIPVPIPIAWYEANKPIDNTDDNSTDETEPEQNSQSRVTENFKPLQKNINNIESNENRLDDDDGEDGLKRMEDTDVVTNSEKPHVPNKAEEETSEENDDSDIKGENIIQHYSKLLKWIEYPV